MWILIHGTNKKLFKGGNEHMARDRSGSNSLKTTDLVSTCAETLRWDGFMELCSAAALAKCLLATAEVKLRNCSIAWSFR